MPSARLTPKVAIIGGGPGGLTLARLLQHQLSLAVTVFEGEASSTARSQGSSLDLHTNEGLLAMKEMGLYDAFLKHARFEGEGLCMRDKHGNIIMRTQSSTSEKDSQGKPEIDRKQLRQVLLDGLTEGTVQWGKRVQIIDDESKTIHFQDGTTASGFDLLVGADGAWSKVRPLVSSVKPAYSGIGGFGMQIPDAANTQPELFEFVNKCSVMCLSDGKHIGSQYRGDGSLYVYAWGHRDENFPETFGFDPHDVASTRAACAKIYADWSPLIRSFTQVGVKEELEYRALYELPVDHSWPHRTGVTLLGDAAHLMTPFSGKGVNLAMQDALFLAKAIKTAVEDGSDLDEAVEGFEKEMFTRAEKTARFTQANVKTILDPRTPESLLEFMKLRMKQYGMKEAKEEKKGEVMEEKKKEVVEAVQ